MKVPAFIDGCIAPVFTVFREDGSLDEDGQRNLLDFIFDRGAVNAFFIRSGLGQMYTFEYEDVRRIITSVCAHMKDRIPVLTGCTGAWNRNYDKRPDPRKFIEECLELGRHAQDAGAAGIVYTVPEALTPENGVSCDGLQMRFFTAVCENVSLPVFIYQPPGTRKEYMISPELVQRLAGIDNLCGMKASTADGEYLFRMNRAAEGLDFSIIAGAETIYYAALYAGSRAVIGQGCTMNPHVIRAIRDRFDAGDRQGVLAAQHSTNILVDRCPNPVDFFKMYASEKGFPAGTTARMMENNPYLKNREPLSREAYERYRDFFELETIKFS
jgi:4-hydroxy-tetrahydrodipicolinate synthase